MTEFEQAPCDDCWETTREYSLMLMMTNGGMTYIANGSVTITVVPLPVPGMPVYRIIRCYDAPKR
ncbi:MAG: hypothetical protein NTW97_07490 [Candidatus Krumholzibacteria bacterium]|nr:hypothetical protein [Candidatus Krumholzibacteria bacterium]